MLSLFWATLYCTRDDIHNSPSVVGTIGRLVGHHSVSRHPRTIKLLMMSMPFSHSVGRLLIWDKINQKPSRNLITAFSTVEKYSNIPSNVFGWLFLLINFCA